LPSQQAENYNRIRLLEISSAEARTAADILFYTISKGIDKKYQFDDQELLKNALLSETGNLRIQGTIKGMFHKTYVIENRIVPIAYCSTKQIAAFLTSPATIDNISENYLHAGHNKIGQLIRQKNWKSAIAVWKHLQERQLVSPQLVLDIGDCFLQNGQTEEALAHCKEYLEGYRNLKDVDFFLKIGDILAEIPSKEAEQLALKSYNTAERLIKREERKIEFPH
jgi:hypothetical protein